MIRRLTAVLVALALALSPALAAFSALTLVSSAAQTASGNGAWLPIPASSQVVVLLDITTGSTVTRFDAWVQGTNDSTDATGFDAICDLAMKSDPTNTTSPTVTVGKRSIADNHIGTTATRYTCVIKSYPYKYIRAKWLFTGTSVTFSMTAGAK